MFITLSETHAAEMVAAARDQAPGAIAGYLFARRLDDGDVMQTVIFAPQLLRKQRTVPVLAALSGDLAAPEVPKNAVNLQVVACVANDGSGAMAFYQIQHHHWEPVEHEVIRLHADLFSRVQGVFDTKALAKKHVLIVGMGTGGGLAALELAKCGLGEFTIVDPDRVRVHNVSRHVCTLNDVGRLKTTAMKEAILARNPEAIVHDYPLDIMDDYDLLERLVRESDLVLACTDNDRSRYRLNDVCLQTKRPVIFAGAFERAFGGQVTRVVPDETPCYSCVWSLLAGMTDTNEGPQVFDYSGERHVLKAEPGLSVDVAFIVLLQVKMALLTLLRGSDTRLVDTEENTIIWINQPNGDYFKEPFQAYKVKTSVRPDCLFCQIGTLTEGMPSGTEIGVSGQ